MRRSILPARVAERDTTDGSAAARPAAAEADASREQGARRVEGARPEATAGHEDGSRPADGTGAAPAGAFAGDGPTVLTGTRAMPSHDEQPTQEVPTTSGRSPDGTTEGSTPTTRSPATHNGDPADSSDETTRPTATTATTLIPADPPTEQIPVTAAGPVAPSGRPAGPPTTERARPSRRRRLLLVAGLLGALVLLYLGDLALSSGTVPRGVSVAGVDVGGLGLVEAEQRLRTEIGPRATQPVAVTVGEAASEIDPAAAGLAVDWAGTLEQVGAQPLNPVTRINSFFTTRDVDVETTADRPELDAALAELAPVVDRAPTEGSVRFDGTTPEPVDPVPGQQLDLPRAADVLQRDWPTSGSVALPLVVLPPSTTPEDVATAIEEVARPAVAGPVTVTGEGGAQGTLTPGVIATAISFRADSVTGGLVPEINQAAVTDALTPQLASSERPGRDAALDFSSGSPVITPSQDGRGVDYAITLKDLLPVLTGTGSRQLTAVYADQPAELTTEELSGLGITGVIGEFTTRGFASDSGRNIKRAAEVINGTILEPGETFSLNGATVPRNAANGYVEAGIISDGHPSRGIGGGVSQVATTVYNAAYFAGMTDVAHQEHSFYISRYPAGREATVFEGAIDLKFRNDNPTGVLIQTAWTPDSITVRLYGTKRYEVTSTPGQRTSPTSPKTVTIPAGEPCSPSGGAPGFTVTDTRTLREVATGRVRNETQTVVYKPSPIVVCST